MLCGTIGVLAMYFIASQNLTTAWSTFPGRYISTMLETGLVLPLAVSVVLFAAGLGIMLTEYNKKD